MASYYLSSETSKAGVFYWQPFPFCYTNLISLQNKFIVCAASLSQHSWWWYAESQGNSKFPHFWLHGCAAFFLELCVCVCAQTPLPLVVHTVCLSFWGHFKLDRLVPLRNLLCLCMSVSSSVFYMGHTHQPAKYNWFFITLLLFDCTFKRIGLFILPLLVDC